MSNIRKYKLVAGVNVDLDNGTVIKGYYLEKIMYDGGSPGSFFIPGNIDSAVAHIRKTHRIIDKARLGKISKFLDEASKDLEIEKPEEIVTEVNDIIETESTEEVE